jgi:serine/threonine protein kinase
MKQVYTNRKFTIEGSQFMLQPGDEIKDYTLVKFLGKGGFGEVWLAEKKIELADKRVKFALKFISGENRGGADLETVKREVNTWIEASGNKQVVSVMDGFMHGDLFVIVSEYADGGSLREWLKTNGGKAPTVEKAVELMGGVLDGLTHLHNNKIVHRDLKPENILLKGEVPCIADFGVSRVIETLTFGESFGTNSAGSPHYMSPESFERIVPAPQVDVWSAGVILYEMLCGKFPYQADTVPSLIFEIITKDPKPMPPTVPQAIQNVVKKSLSKHAVERYASAKEMRDALLKAYYLQDQVPTITDEEMVKTKISADILIKQKSQPEIAALRQGLTESPTKKFFNWTYATTYAAAGLFLMLGAVGITSWALLGNRADNLQSQPTTGSQSKESAPMATPATAANAVAETPVTTSAPKTENANPAKPTASKTPQTVENQKEKSPDTKVNTVLKTTPTPKNPTVQTARPKPTEDKKKKPTLDDLLNKN